MNSTLSDIREHSFSVADFLEFGSRYAIDYRFQATEKSSVVVRGLVEEWRLASGLSVTHSDLHVLRPYESTSAGHSPLYLLVVLEGCVDLRLNGKPLTITAGMALCTRLGKQWVLNASHRKDQRLVTVSLGLCPSAFHAPHPLAVLLENWQQASYPGAVRRLPESLRESLCYAISRQTTAMARELMLEGLMLQLLGLVLKPQDGAGEQSLPALCWPGEHERLETVRQLLESSPEKKHTLSELAKTAAMSSSSLRVKFRQAYGESVFNYLRDCRLALARRYLQQGYSVQQAAWMSGYQHATNFSTAFRRRYGMSPGNLHAGLSVRG